MDIVTISIIISAVIIVLGTTIQAIAQGRAVISAMESMARQPEVAGPIGTNLIIGLAFIESLSIYVLVIALILIFAEPYTQNIKNLDKAKAEVEILELQLRKIELQKQAEQMMLRE